ncbi:ArsR family transcriptional regulator [Streptomyces sp. NPDC127037]|uniref:ArsR family transcriptional regulator n=1 Tax=Streptomyces sp. NPDC127037 TaxID=3347113 RepID=UPI00365E871A
MTERAPAGEACVCDLADCLGFRQPTVSHHLTWVQPQSTPTASPAVCAALRREDRPVREPYFVAAQPRCSASSRSSAAFGLAPTIVCTTSPPL